MSNIQIIKADCWFNSCDYCNSQEDGGHYCLLHGEQMKNMDIVKCDDWTPKEGNLNENKKAKEVL